MRESERRPTAVIRVRGQWSLCALDSFDPVPSSLTAVLATLGPEAGPRDAAPDGSVDEVVPADDARLSEVWGWIGSVEGGAVVIDDVDGGSLPLDAVDLRILDAVGDSRGATVGSVAAVAGLPTPVVARRAARLGGAGRLVVSAPAVATSANPEPATPPHGAADDSPVASLGPSASDRWTSAAHEVTARVRDAYRLSSKLAPVRRRLAKWGVPEPVTPAPPSRPSGGSQVLADVDPAPFEDRVEPATPPEHLVRSETVGVRTVVPVAVSDDGRHPDDDGPPGRIPVYAPWHSDVGPLLALGLVVASARRFRDGALTRTYEIRRPEHTDSFLEHLPTHGPAILLMSDYVWSIDANLALARRAREINPDVFVVHGGPSCPKYEGDAQRFLHDHGDVAHLLVRGEGEEVICDVLDALAPTDADPGRLNVDDALLGAIAGLTFVAGDGEIVRTAERDRIADVDAVPSPYLTGEFDHVPSEAWSYCLPIETTRGCPYGCTFCDWGSSTMSRVRKFDFARVQAEIDWATERRIHAINLADANFGIMRRDVDTARYVADARRRTGYPNYLAFYPAKNTTKHLMRIMDLLGEANIASAASLSLQSTDAAILEALDRSNISTDHFVALAADYRRRGHPLLGDLLIGIPEQTYDTYRTDLQFMLDHEILVRTWPVQMLPNSPMNDPEYKARHGIVVDDRNLVVEASTFTIEDRAAMLRLRMVDIVCERLGLLRHVMRWMQWDHGLAATELMDHLIDVVDRTPDRVPALAWTLRIFDRAPTVAIGWHRFYEDVRAVLIEDFEVVDDQVLECVLEVQRALMPQPGREFPDVRELPHDYVAYYRDATASLHTTGHAGTPPRPLAAYPPGRIEVTGDPLDLCGRGPEEPGDSRNESMQSDFLIGAYFIYELESPLVRQWPLMVAKGIRSDLFDEIEAASAPALDQFDGRVQDGDDVESITTRVELLRSNGHAASVGTRTATDA